MHDFTKQLSEEIKKIAQKPITLPPSREDLLKQIQQGVGLKKTEQEKKPKVEKKENFLESQLKKRFSSAYGEEEEEEEEETAPVVPKTVTKPPVVAKEPTETQAPVPVTPNRGDLLADIQKGKKLKKPKPEKNPVEQAKSEEPEKRTGLSGILEDAFKKISDTFYGKKEEPKEESTEEEWQD